MASPLRWSLLRRRWSVSAPRMTVRRHVPWWQRLGVVGLAVGAGVVAALAGWQVWAGGDGAAGARAAASLVEENRGLRASLEAREAEVQRLSGIANAAETSIRMERAAAEQLAAQMKALEADNARLRNDLATLQSLAGARAARPSRADRPATPQTRARE